MVGESKKTKVLLLCAGSGGRFVKSIAEESVANLTGLDSKELERLKDTPKPLLEIGGKTLLEHVMGSFRTQGFDEFVIMTGQGAGIIDSAVTALGRKGFKAEIIRQNEDEAILKQIISATPALGKRFFLGLGVAVNDANLEDMLKNHTSGDNKITTLYQSWGFKPYAGVSLIDSDFLSEPGVEERMLKRYRGTWGDIVAPSREDSMWGFLGSGDPYLTENHIHIRKLNDLIKMRKIWDKGEAFWSGAYAKNIEMLPTEGILPADASSNPIRSNRRKMRPGGGQ